MTELIEILKTLKSENPHNDFVEKSVIDFVKKRVIDITNNGISVVSIYLDDKYAQFYDEYTQTASQIEELKPLITHLEREGYYFMF